MFTTTHDTIILTNTFMLSLVRLFIFFPPHILCVRMTHYVCGWFV